MSDTTTSFLNMTLTGTQESEFRKKWDTMWHEGFEQTVSKLEPFVTVRTNVTGDKIKSSWISGLSVHEYSGSRQQNQISDLKFGHRVGTKRKFSEMVPISVDEVMDMDRANYNVGLIEAKMRKAVGPFKDLVIWGLEHVTKASTDPTYLTGYDNSATITGYQLPTSGRKGGILGINTMEDDNGDEQDAALDYSRKLVEDVDTWGKNLVPVDYATTGTGVSSDFAGSFHDKIGYVIRKLVEGDAMTYDTQGANNLVVAISPEVQQLLRAYEIGLNRDYQMSVLGDGSFNKFLRCTVMVSNLTPTITTQKLVTGNSPSLTDVSAVACTAWLKDQVELLMWRDTQFQIVNMQSQFKDVDYAVKCRGALGCQRLNDNTVFVIPMEKQA